MKTQKVKGGGKKIGRNKKPVNSATSMYVRGVISFDQYSKEKK